MKPVCANCHLFFQAEKSGFYFEEGMPVSNPRVSLRTL